MEKLSKVSKPVRQKTPGNQMEENDAIQDGKLQTKQERTDEGQVGVNRCVICL